MFEMLDGYLNSRAGEPYVKYYAELAKHIIRHFPWKAWED